MDLKSVFYLMALAPSKNQRPSDLAPKMPKFQACFQVLPTSALKTGHKYILKFLKRLDNFLEQLDTVVLTILLFTSVVLEAHLFLIILDNKCTEK